MNVQLKDVSVSYGTNVFTFKDTVFPDETISFITGKNGSGKTTLLKSIAGLLSHSGEISVRGTYVSQNPVVFSRSVKENILYPIQIRNKNIDEYDALLNHLVDTFDVRDLLEQDARTLSGGEQMKTTIIRALIFQPRVILLDEPTTHLDLESIAELEKLIKEYKHKIKFIIVSHNQSFMEHLMDDEYRLE